MKKILSLLVFSLLALASSVQAANYKLDSAHSAVNFKVKHLGISDVSGSFSKVTGSFSFDPKDFSKATAEAKIETASIYTANKDRDNHLRSADFFNVEKFPSISYKASSIKQSKVKDSYKVNGILTMHGVSKPVVLDMKYLGIAKDSEGKEHVAFRATTKLNRKDFGLLWSQALEMAGVVGQEVNIVIEVEGQTL